MIDSTLDPVALLVQFVAASDALIEVFVDKPLGTIKDRDPAVEIVRERVDAYIEARRAVVRHAKTLASHYDGVFRGDEPEAAA